MNFGGEFGGSIAVKVLSSSLLSRTTSLSYISDWAVSNESRILGSLRKFVRMLPVRHNGQEIDSQRGDSGMETQEARIVVRVSSAFMHCVSKESDQFIFSTQGEHSCFGKGSVFLI